MNVSEGAVRMQRAGRSMVLIGLCAFVICACLSAFIAFLPASLHVAAVFGFISPILFSVLWIAAMAMAAGAVLWIAGWILEGFAKNNSQ